MPILNQENETCNNCQVGRLRNQPRISDIIYELNANGLFLINTQSVELNQFHSNCPKCPNGLIMKKE